MSILFDFLPILFFFTTFKYAELNKAWASRFANDHLSSLVSGGVVAEQDAAVLLATVVVILATLAQVVVALIQRKRVSSILLISLGLVTVLGGATIWFHDKRLIMWKPTALYWAMGVVFWLRARLVGATMMQSIVGDKLELPEFVWRRLNQSWLIFFAAMGVLNLYVAHSFSTETWVSFKLFGGLGLMLLFVLAQGFYMERHARPELVSETSGGSL